MKSVYLCSPSLSVSHSQTRGQLSGTTERRRKKRRKRRRRSSSSSSSIQLSPAVARLCLFHTGGNAHKNWFPCFLAVSNLPSFIILKSISAIFPSVSSVTPSLAHSLLFVLLINFITLIAPHCLRRKQLPSLPPSAQLSSPPSPLFPSLVAESSN